MAEGLSAHIRRGMLTPFAWGSHDCATWAADWAAALSGVDCAPWRGRYTDQVGAEAYTAAHGGAVACFGAGVERGLRRVESLDQADVGIIRVRGVMVCAVRAPHSWCALSRDGIARIRQADVIAIWGL